MIEELKEMIREFDNEHIIKQIIIVGIDGAIKNIEMEVEVV